LPNFLSNNSKEAKKICPGRKKFEATKWQNVAKSGRRETGIFVCNYFDENTIAICNFLNFYELSRAIIGV
jgi:hypothetical protein